MIQLNQEKSKAHPIIFCRANNGFAKILAGVFIILLVGFHGFGQEPMVVQEPEETPRISIPGRAAMLSAALPGLGQAYNRAFWKIPIIYAGFGGVVFAVNFNQNLYNDWRAAYIAKVDGNPNTIDQYPAYSDAALRRVMEFYRRNLELSYIAGVALYLLNILDASVQAHLMDFDVGEDLSMQVAPSVSQLDIPIAGLRQAPGIKLTFRF